MKTRLSWLVGAVALLTVAACSKDLTPIKNQALEVVSKYAPQLKTATETVSGLLGRVKTLPPDLPVVGGLVSKLTAKQETLTQLQGLLDGAPAQIDALVKEGKADELKALTDKLGTDVGKQMGEVTGDLEALTTEVGAAEGEAKTAAVKTEILGLGEKFAPQVTAAQTALDNLLARVKGVAVETPGAPELTTEIEAARTATATAKTTLDGLAAAVEGKTAEELATFLATTTTDLTTVTTKLATDIPALTARMDAMAAGPVLDWVKMLPGDVEIKGVTNGAENQLVAFVEDAARPVDKETWFNFDRLTFTVGSANLDVEASKDQIANLVAILNAFPALKLKIGGYTDNTGDAAANKALSQQRAEAVVKALVDAGVVAERLEAEGYGPEHPVCEANDTEECRAQNRRIAMRVTAK